VTCQNFEDQLGAYIDRELDAAARQDMEEHLRECPACRSSYARQRALSATLREQLPTFEAPDLLRARVEGALRGAHSERATTPTRRWRWAAIAASALLVATASYSVLATRDAVSPQDELAHEVLASHVRSLMPEHLTDVASSDQHTVKPWFNGKLDYSPPVYDLATQGFPLIGGRLDYIGGRPVAALVYQRRKHVINLFLWPTERKDQRAPEMTRQGYHLLHWTRAGTTYWTASDLNETELREFARLQQQADSTAAAGARAR
jgi:anti-sigma factor RsiW